MSENLKDLLESSNTPTALSLERVLEQFLLDVTAPISSINQLLPNLAKITFQEDYREIFSQLQKAWLPLKEHILLFNDYLQSQNSRNWQKISASQKKELAAFLDGVQPIRKGSYEYSAYGEVEFALMDKFLSELRRSADSIRYNMTLCPLAEEAGLPKERLEEMFEQSIVEIVKWCKVVTKLLSILEHKRAVFETVEFDRKLWNKSEVAWSKSQQPNQDILLQMAIGKFLDTHMTRSYEDTFWSYLTSSKLFKLAMEQGPIPNNLLKFANGSKYLAKIYFDYYGPEHFIQPRSS